MVGKAFIRSSFHVLRSRVVPCEGCSHLQEHPFGDGGASCCPFQDIPIIAVAVYMPIYVVTDRLRSLVEMMMPT